MGHRPRVSPSPSFTVRVRLRLVIARVRLESGLKVRDTYRRGHREKPPEDTYRQVSSGDTQRLGTYGKGGHIGTGDI